MDTIETVFIGIIQGLTEFLPISSSGHLVIVKNLLGFKEPELILDSSLHLGTLLAVCLYLRSDIKQIITEIWHKDFKGPHASLAWWVLIGTLPTALIALTLKERFERFYESVPAVGIMLIITGIILFASWIGRVAIRPNTKSYGTRTRIGVVTALSIGIVQGFAIIPGISRSAITIVCGLLCGLNRDLAGRFSFLLSIPMIVGWHVLNLRADTNSTMGFIPLVIGFGTSAIVGFLALKILMFMIREGHLHYFAPYCWAVGFLAIMLAQ